VCIKKDYKTPKKMRMPRPNLGCGVIEKKTLTYQCVYENQAGCTLAERR
jgi:hypothetical protein